MVNKSISIGQEALSEKLACYMVYRWFVIYFFVFVLFVCFVYLACIRVQPKVSVWQVTINLHGLT